MFKSIMHIALNTDQMEEMIDFYTNKMGGKVKCLNRFKAYANRADRPAFQKLAKDNPEGIFNVYIEVCPGEFLELFPKAPGQGDVPGFNANLGYSHFALTCDDIFAVRKELEAKGVVFDTEISKGPSETYQMWTHDPDGNKFEIMQFTEKSWQIVGHID